MKYLKTNGFKVLILIIILIIFLFSSFNSYFYSKYTIDDSFILSTEKEASNGKYYIDDYRDDYWYVYTTSNTSINVFFKDKLVNVYSPQNHNKLYKISLDKGAGKYKIIGVNKDTSEQIFNYSKVVKDTPNKYLNSNSMVDFLEKPSTNYLASKLNNKNDIKQAVLDTTKYINKNIKYSDKNLIKQNYIVNTDLIINRGYGICTDLAALECAILRINKIPCKLVYGYYKNEFHAWCSVKIKTKWVLVDPTNNISLADKNYKSLYEY